MSSHSSSSLDVELSLDADNSSSKSELDRLLLGLTGVELLSLK